LLGFDIKENTIIGASAFFTLLCFNTFAITGVLLRLCFCAVQETFTTPSLLHSIKIEEQTKRNNLRQEHHPERK
jgi:hypothetical protein